MNLPNKLTLLRIFMIPVFAVLFLLKDTVSWFKYVACAVFIIASLTDLLDGYLARKNNLVTNFGKFADPLADKMLVCTALLCLMHFDLIPTWIVIVIIMREFIISGFRLVACEQKVVLAASVLGKIKTNVQICMTVGMILDFQFGFWQVTTQILMWAALFFTVVSLIDYLVKNWGIMKGQM